MKPLKLTIQAFSAYLNKTVIDFEELNKRGLYLICGDTGSGKTTIFDAICFALYKETSGTFRSHDIFRSHYASYNIPTIVELTFMLNSKVYTVHREHKYSKTGKTATDNDYILSSDKTISGVIKVNERMKELLQVDVRQFRQIVMIAQGEFSKLLTASSDDRVKIFRNIFHTEKLVEIEKLLKEKNSLLDKQYTLLSDRLNTLYSQYTGNDDIFNEQSLSLMKEELSFKNNEIEKYQILLKESKEKLQKASDKLNQVLKINELFRQYDFYQQSLEELLKCKKTYKEQIHSIELMKKAKELSYQEETIHTLDRQIKELEELLKNNKDRQRKLFNKEESFIKEKEKLPEYQKELQFLNEMIKRQEDLISYQHDYLLNDQKINELKSTYQELIKKQQEKQARREKLSRHLSRDQLSITEYTDLAVKKNQLETKMKKVNERKIQLHYLSDDYETLYILRENHYDKIHEFDKQRAIYNRCFELYKETYDHYMSQLTGHLAASLKEGEQCPVCGSIHHPDLAVLEGKKIDINDLNRLEKAADKEKDAFDLARDNVLKAQEEIKQKESVIKTLSESLGITQDLNKELFIYLLNDISQQEKTDRQDYLEISNRIEYLDKLKESVKESQNDLDYLNEELSFLEKKIQNILIDKNGLESINLEIIRQYPELKDFDKETILLIKAKKERLEKKIDSFVKMDTFFISQKTELQTQIKEQEIQIQKTVLLKTEKENILITGMKNDFHSSDDYQYYKNLLEEYDDYEKNVRNYENQYYNLNENLKSLNHQLEGKIREDQGFYQKAFDDLKNKIEIEEDDFKEMMMDMQRKKKLYSDIKKLYQKSENLLKEYGHYHTLYEMTSGRNSAKLSFERYVLTSYFDCILDYANVELRRLTQSRYQFMRRLEAKGNSGQGLDLNVIDYQTGLSRDIKSLSGGESFKAALALALGLSSMIQSYAGGIELNALFIDEGFGTLDDESLNQAIEVLADLKSDNKVIGIISHVGEIKDRIDAYIEVKKGNNGSLLTVRV